MPYQHRRKKPAKRPRPEGIVLQRRKRARKRAERETNPWAVERRFAEQHRQRRMRLEQERAAIMASDRPWATRRRLLAKLEKGE